MQPYLEITSLQTRSRHKIRWGHVAVGGYLLQCNWSIYEKRHWDRHMGKIPWDHEGKPRNPESCQPSPEARKRQGRISPRVSEEVQLSWPPDFRSLASRTVRESISVVLNHLAYATLLGQNLETKIPLSPFGLLIFIAVMFSWGISK